MLVPLNQELQRLRIKTQNLTNENYNMNDIKVKIIEDERQRLAKELRFSKSTTFRSKYDVISDKRNRTRTTLNQQIPVLEKMIQESQLEMRALLLHLRPLGLKDKSLGKVLKI